MKTTKVKNTILKALAAGVLVFSAASCSESFLDVESMTEPNSDSYYKNQPQAWRALLGCYNGYLNISVEPGPFGFMLQSIMMSDECYGGGCYGNDPNVEVVDRFNTAFAPSEASIMQADWTSYYAGIYRCNVFLGKIDDIPFDDEALKAQYKAEASLLRALLYFDVVRLWGNVPLLLEPSTGNPPQADPADVYAAIFDDLRFAIDNIPADANKGVENFGRVNKYVAEGIFARAYLYYTGYYNAEAKYSDGTAITAADALAYAEDVIANGGYSLVPEFKNLWPAASLVPVPGANGWDTEASTYAGNCNSEVIFAQNFTPIYSYNDGQFSGANRWLVGLGLRNITAPSLGLGMGWGLAPVTTAYINKFFSNNDLRRSASIIDYAADGVAALSNFSSLYNDAKDYTGYAVRKYTPMQYGSDRPATSPDGSASFMENGSQNFVVLRLADVMLMAAELGSPNAADYMHLIRSRAGLGDVPVTKQNIMDERARELAFEGVRYWDLMRLGVEVMADAVMASAGETTDGGHASRVTYDRARIVATQGLCQIPATEISISNGVLKQNPGW